MSNIQLVILSGGYGNRMKPLTKHTPKSLLKIRNGQTILDYQLKHARQQGIRNIIILTGDKSDMIREYLHKKRRVHGLTFARSLNGTGGSLKSVLSLLEEDFICQYGDVYLKIDYTLLYNFHKLNSPYMMTMTVHPRRSLPYNPNNVDYTNNRVTFYGKGRFFHKGIDAGVSVINRRVVEDVENDVWDLSDIIPELVRVDQVKAFITDKEPFEVGSFEGLEHFKEMLKK